MQDDREFREQLKRDIAIGQTAAAAVLYAAGEVEHVDELDGPLDALTQEQARLGLAFLACLHARKTQGGARYLPSSGEDRTDALVATVVEAADEGSFIGARAAALDAGGERSRFALGLLAMTYRAQRIDVIATALQAEQN